MFEFVTAGRILFGPGAMNQAGTLAAELGHKVLIASGRPSQDTSALTKRLQNTGMEAVLFPVRGEPTIELVHEATELARADSGVDQREPIVFDKQVEIDKNVSDQVNMRCDLHDYAL